MTTSSTAETGHFEIVFSLPEDSIVTNQLPRPVAALLEPGSTLQAPVVSDLLFFSSDPVTDYDSARRSDTNRFARFFWAMMDRGIYLPCSQFEAAFVSAVHTDQQIAQTVTAARQALAEVAAGS